MYRVEYYADSDVGLVRKKNEDSFAILGDENFFAIADGLGGHKAGEVASREAVSYLCQAVKELFASTHTPLTAPKLEEFLSSIFQNVNSWVHHLSCNIEDYQGMGTTLSSALLFQEHLIYSHVGDSRIYQYRNQKLTQLTLDHAQIEANYSKSLTQIIGSSRRIKADSKIIKALPGDSYILCSDGLTDSVKESQIYDILSLELPARVKTKELISSAKRQGGSDNITVLVIDLK
jgi:serine/threonine protein phosphatase PrpC